MPKDIKITPRKKLTGFVHGFKDFITKGNVVDMAIGVIIGGAFGKIISSLVNDIIMPAIGVLIGGVDFRDLKWLIKQRPILDDQGAQVVIDGISQFSRVYINYGNFIQITLEFIIIAFAIYAALFFVIRRKQMEEKLIKEEMDRIAAEKAEGKEPAAPTKVVLPPNIVLLTEIRDLLSKDKHEKK